MYQQLSMGNLEGDNCCDLGPECMPRYCISVVRCIIVGILHQNFTFSLLHTIIKEASFKIQF